MRKLLPFLLLFLLSSCTLPSLLGTDGNPFLEEIPITAATAGEVHASSDGNSFEFVIVTDAHLGSEGDRRVTLYNDNFEAFLQENTQDGGYPFMVSLGDLTEKGDYSSDEALSFIARFSPYTSGNFLPLVGNHELHRGGTLEEWKEYYAPSPTTCRYTYSGVSFYKLNSPKRIYGKEQLSELREALENDENPFRIVLTHENLTTGHTADHSLFYYGSGDITERNRLYRIFTEGNVSLILEGHHHLGNIVSYLSTYLAELNLGSYRRKVTQPIQYEGMGWWYVAKVDKTAKTITVTPYYAATGEAQTPYTFRMK